MKPRKSNYPKEKRQRGLIGRLREAAKSRKT
jgi:hypothetical protein